HVGLRVRTIELVDAFHAAALAAGGSSDGAPGLRPHHGEGYYAAFVRDPDGNRIEAVTFLKAQEGFSLPACLALPHAEEHRSTSGALSCDLGNSSPDERSEIREPCKKARPSRISLRSCGLLRSPLAAQRRRRGG